ncbi:hypothetical protein G9409_09710 [Chlorobium sp. BLA1]|uniref:hypothetical protein n=1 Tax=Candidatus Chlorobium masyuteum TaxID=2716876 RepID=UPI001421F7AD|nr:hypothetical protein [Candidatus Chlorobium masyuteum]NHQ60852.1 hypothetical protein [Candidatus Chlorobium masyuteum]NTU45780.1 hypothetical protein [Chlorobiaceae bacterium]
MSELEKSLAWTNIPVPEVLRQLPFSQQQQILSWAETLVSHKTDGFEELYNAIGMIVKYIPNFVVIPLMVDHIKPRIAAGVCGKMGVDQAVGYANDLPIEYFNEVSLHLEAPVMAQILEKMKKNSAEKFILSELKNRLDRMLDIAQHLDKRMLEIVAKHVTLPENEEELLNHPHKPVFDKIRALQ